MGSCVALFTERHLSEMHGAHACAFGASYCRHDVPAGVRGILLTSARLHGGMPIPADLPTFAWRHGNMCTYLPRMHASPAITHTGKLACTLDCMLPWHGMAWHGMARHATPRPR
eukprot:365963-Chlamydomonas_euryale.AAC.6